MIGKRKIKILIPAVIILFVTVSIFANGVSNERNTPIANNAMGINAHLSFDCSINFTEDLCKCIKEAGIKSIRFDVYWSYKDFLFQEKVCDKVLYFASKYNIDVLLNFPQMDYNLKNEKKEKWIETLVYYAKRYNGVTKVKVEDSDTVITVNNFEILNEPDINHKKKALSIKETYNLIKESSIAIKGVRKNAKIVLPGLSSRDESTKQLLNYRDSNGYTLAHYCDVFNVHIYRNNINAFEKELNEWKKLKQHTEFENKEFWLTEYGNTLWYETVENQAEMLVKQMLYAYSIGIDRVYYYQLHQFGGNFFNNTNQGEDYYGIIEPSVSNSYCSFLRNDGEFKTAICDGDATKKVLVKSNNTDTLFLYWIDKNIIRRLKTKGLAIGGRDIQINKILIKESNVQEKLLWSGNMTFSQTNQVISIPPSLFERITSSDKIAVCISHKIADNKWIGVKPLPAFLSYKFISSFLQEGSTDFAYIKDSMGLKYKVSWKTPNGMYHYCFWSDNILGYCNTISNANIKMYDIYGDPIKSGDINNFKMPVFIESKVPL